MRSVMIKSVTLAIVSALLLACGGGGGGEAAEFMKKGLAIQNHAISILEGTKDRPDMAGDALLRYAKENKAEIAELKKASEKFQKDMKEKMAAKMESIKDDGPEAMAAAMEEMKKVMQEEMGPLMAEMEELEARRKKLPAELMANPKVMEAMKLLK